MSPSKKTAPSPRPARRTPPSKAQEPAQGLEPGLPLAFEQIQALLAQVGREPIEEFELESLGVRLRIRKPAGPAPARPVPAAGPPPASGLAPVLAAAPAPAPEQPEDPGLHPITSPIVGTFYRAPSATSAPFVQPGDFVKPGQTLCIVEAMKLMNEIECDVAGEVAAVLVENGQPVEYGERLFAIRVR